MRVLDRFQNFRGSKKKKKKRPNTLARDTMNNPETPSAPVTGQVLALPAVEALRARFPEAANAARLRHRAGKQQSVETDLRKVTSFRRA